MVHLTGYEVRIGNSLQRQLMKGRRAVSLSTAAYLAETNRRKIEQELIDIIEAPRTILISTKKGFRPAKRQPFWK